MPRPDLTSSSVRASRLGRSANPQTRTRSTLQDRTPRLWLITTYALSNDSRHRRQIRSDQLRRRRPRAAETEAHVFSSGARGTGQAGPAVAHLSSSRHGWKGDVPSAIDQSDRWIGAMWRLRPTATPRADVSPAVHRAALAESALGRRVARSPAGLVRRPPARRYASSRCSRRRCAISAAARASAPRCR